MKFIPYPGWRIRFEGGLIYHEPLVWWKRWPRQLWHQSRQTIRRLVDQALKAMR
jgi:hypothetical protein